MEIEKRHIGLTKELLSLQVESEEEFQTLCFEADLCPYRFVYTSLDGEEVELCTDGANIAVTLVFFSLITDWSKSVDGVAHQFTEL